MAKPVRTKNKDNARRAKKKISLLVTERVEYVDWKDVNLLRRFMSDRAKIRARRVTGNNVQQQAEIARAIKNAREMAPQQPAGMAERGADPRRQRSEEPPYEHQSLMRISDAGVYLKKQKQQKQTMC